MKNKKNIIIAATLAILGISVNSAFADTNNLIQMDIKRSSVTDTVDVTFYTTADSGNSVVTRKSSNRYVVLLPNTMSSSSATPNFGGVRDLITDVDVKHVNDGMGGYTKVTFGTTKPINIKTHMAKTAPLSQEQKEARALVAKNNAMASKPAEAKPTANNVVAKATATPAAKSTAKPAQAQHTTTPIKVTNSIPGLKLITFEPPKKVANTNTNTSKKEQPKVTPKTQTTASVAPKQTTNASTYVPKVKVDSNGKRVIDLEPRVNHSITPETTPAQTAVPEQITDIQPSTPIVDNSENNVEQTAEPTPVEDNSSSFPYWILYAGGAVVLLCIIYLVHDAMKHSAEKSKSRLDSFYDISAKNQAKRRKKEYYDIINNEEYSWQEKYKLYNEKGNANVPEKHVAAMSYVTDISGLKKAENQPKDIQISEPKIAESHEQVINEKMKAKMLELEKSYNRPAIEKSAEVSEVQSEDNVIMKNFSEIKLKSFSKPMSLKETNRTLISNEEKPSRNTSYKEGKFIKLKNSAKTLHSQKNFGTNDLINAGNKYLQDINAISNNSQKADYVLSSVDEYLSILDTETPNLQPMPTAKVKTPTSVAMKRSGVSNPIASKAPKVAAQLEKHQEHDLAVKSGYSIDPERGFYVVNMDGVSAIVGKAKDNIFILKKFDHVVDGTIQVRRDDGNIYIVRLGKFKCLVNVEQDKMGTLIEI